MAEPLKVREFIASTLSHGQDVISMRAPTIAVLAFADRITRETLRSKLPPVHAIATTRRCTLAPRFPCLRDDHGTLGAMRVTTDGHVMAASARAGLER